MQLRHVFLGFSGKKKEGLNRVNARHWEDAEKNKDGSCERGGDSPPAGRCDSSGRKKGGYGFAEESEKGLIGLRD